MSPANRDGAVRRAPSMADVAAVAGVSHQTVSRVVNDHPLVKDATRARVQQAMAQLGYRRNSAARALVTNRSGLIGLVGTHLGLYGPGMVAAAVQDAAHEAGYGVAQVGLPTLSPTALRETVERLLDRAVEAVVVGVTQREALDTVAALDLPVPVVLTQGVVPGQPMAAGIDQEAGAELATTHLVEVAAGAGSIAHVTGPLDWVEAQVRRDGWRRVLVEHGVEGTEVVGDWSSASGYAAGLVLAADPGVRAVFAGNDLMALGVLRALHEQGRRVPEDVAVVGFDDTPESAYHWPPLTTVRQDFTRLGRGAVDLALRALGGEAQPAMELVPPELVVRASTRG